MNCLPRICLSRCVLVATESMEGQSYIDLGSSTEDIAPKKIRACAQNVLNKNHFCMRVKPERER